MFENQPKSPIFQHNEIETFLDIVKQCEKRVEKEFITGIMILSSSCEKELEFLEQSFKILGRSSVDIIKSGKQLLWDIRFQE